MTHKNNMNQFVVPQFIDVEDKIIGPITARQFVILLVCSIVVFFAFKYGDFLTFVLVLIIVGGSGMLFSFAKVNGQAFHYFLLNVAQTWRKRGKRIWQKEYNKDELNFLRKLDAAIEITDVVQKKKVNRSHIQDLALIANTGGFYHPDDMNEV